MNKKEDNNGSVAIDYSSKIDKNRLQTPKFIEEEEQRVETLQTEPNEIVQTEEKYPISYPSPVNMVNS